MDIGGLRLAQSPWDHFQELVGAVVSSHEQRHGRSGGRHPSVREGGLPKPRAPGVTRTSVGRGLDGSSERLVGIPESE